MSHQFGHSTSLNANRTISSTKIKQYRLSSILTLTLALLFVMPAGLSFKSTTAQARAAQAPVTDSHHVAPLAPTALITVTSTADSGPGSLRDTLAAANDGDTLDFSLPDNSIIVLTSGELVVSQSVTIDGSTATNLTVDGNHASRVFNATRPLTVISVTIQNGAADNGGGLSTSSAVTLINVTFLSNTATLQGGGAYATGVVTLQGGLFQNNIATDVARVGFGGGGLYVNSTLDLTGTQFIGNTSNTFGGGAFAYDAATLNNGLFQNNTAAYNGGGLWVFDTLALTGTHFLSNKSGGGGGVYANHEATLKGGLFQNNLSTSGGGGLDANRELNLIDTQFLSNTAVGPGGGVYAFGTATLNSGLFQNNTSTGPTALAAAYMRITRSI